MARTHREKLARDLERLENWVAAGDVPEATLEYAERYRDTLDASKPNTTATDLDGEVYACKPASVQTYVNKFCAMAADGVVLPFADAEAVNDYFDRRHGDDLKASSLRPYCAAARSFYRIFEDLGVDPEAIDTYRGNGAPKHDEQDIFTEDEVFGLRKACARTQNPVRNRAFLELLIFTLQRLTALLTLRVGDVDVDEGAIYLNDDYDAREGGLKGALRRGRRRPVYGARTYLRDWVEARDADSASDWLFVGDHTNSQTAVGDHWSERSARGFLNTIGELADVDKPTNPHNFRHYGITVLRWDYDIPWDEINAQAGVVKGSEMPKTTYNHVDDTDLRRKIEERMGLKDERQNRFAPVVCPVCGEVMKAGWRKCPVCDEQFAPGADEGDAELDWLAAEADMTADTFERVLGRTLERLLEDRGHDDPSA